MADLSAADVYGMLRRHAGGVIEQARKLLVRSLALGEDARIAAKRIANLFNPHFAPRRAVTGRILRGERQAAVGPDNAGRGSAAERRLLMTETSRAHGEAVKARARKSGRLVKWTLAPGHPRADECDDRANADVGFGPGVYRPDDVPPHPSHPNCFPVGTSVRAPSLRASVARWYEGDLIEIATRSDKRLAVTPNHPILTTQGWIVAHQLRPGDDLICGPFPVDAGLVYPNYDHAPSRIEDVAESGWGATCMMAIAMPQATVDFHGDGAEGKISIVRAYRLLRDDAADAALSQQVAKPQLVVADVQSASLPRFRPSALLGVRDGSSAHGGMSACGASESRVVAHARHGNDVRAALIAQGDAGGDQDAVDRGSADSESLGESQDRFARLVAPDDLLCGQLLAWGASADAIERVSSKRFEGHVYNLETREGWYLANDIITHNCRCVLQLDRREA